MADGPLFTYRALVAAGKLKPDPVQLLGAEKLQSVHNALKGYAPESGLGGWKERLGLARRRTEPPQGLYLYGGVGRGKSMLMDLFFETAPVEPRRRVHFHEFMIEIHDAVHAWRQAQKTRKNKETDPLPKLAVEIAADASLLCFDEFHVTDIADAMILARLFEALFQAGVVVVATSNWPPDDLYKDGLQRDSFLPFIDLMKQRLDILHLACDTDYRLIHMKSIKAYHAPLGPAATRALEAAFDDLAGGAAPQTETLLVKGRSISVAHAARGVGRFTFDELCRQPRGAEDYIAIARHFHTVLLDGVARLGEQNRNEAKRFMTLIDALYEHKVKLIMAAEAAPHDLYRGDSHAFEFERTVSRLMEMQSKPYLGERHRAETVGSDPV